MSRVTVAPLAQSDAAQIWAYIAEDDAAAADRLLKRFDEEINLLSTQPHSGKDAAALSDNLRFWPVGKYLIFYRPSAEGIQVVRIIHGARRLRAELFDE